MSGAKRKGAQRTQIPRVEIYKDRGLNVQRRRAGLYGGWRWRLVGANGKILADSGEAYTRKADVKRALGTAFSSFSLARSFDLVEV